MGEPAGKLGRPQSRPFQETGVQKQGGPRMAGEAREERREDKSQVQVIARAATILRALEEQPAGLSLGQIAQRVDLARSTVQRIVAALAAEKLLIAASPTKGSPRPGHIAAGGVGTHRLSRLRAVPVRLSNDSTRRRSRDHKKDHHFRRPGHRAASAACRVGRWRAFPLYYGEWRGLSRPTRRGRGHAAISTSFERRLQTR